jgi:hemolysin III
MYHGERLNSVTHLVGGIVTCLGVFLLLMAAAKSASPGLFVACGVYGAALVSMFTVSTLYHSTRGPKKAWLRKLDHIAIFVLIAGTYTPFCVGPLRGGVGWWLLAAVWGMALVGAVLEFSLAHRSRLPSFVLYFVMAFLALAAFPGLEVALPPSALLWIKGGDFLFALGFVFYVLDKKYRDRHLHGIWHLFVNAGALCMYVSIYGYVV